jgi:hypothetical protein
MPFENPRSHLKPPALFPPESGTTSNGYPQHVRTYYEVPPEYHVTRYRYTYVNDHVILVDPSTHRIVEVEE